ncbi:hypothetical protein [Clostridium sp.]|uniref:hypothetical protein n=1 Tax=Clostridium sp. TaxID=1506 RepID=UPI0035A0A28C
MTNKEKCFEYFNSNKEQLKEDLLKGVVSKFGITRLTAENYYSKWEEEKDVEEAVENIFGKNEINELCENTKFGKGPTAVNEKPKPKKLLKIALLEGKKMDYAIQGGGFIMRQKSAANAIPINFEDIDDFIAELRELKDVVKA